ncbi:helix-turn-helix transcriptional regulator [Arthrobacter sp. FW306-2-2C-D06B]|uniref:helix-turn-helix transcriptional regulator n=1 Tax=Arthrobacter sp. FW306-2-2C-D06B TaxID=2879618 RepID=UPI001F422144|nr:helix-turn-helix transcriptional regulator [Arthrobacter sp. FW306-2-2C-D06B]UKA58629.1 helix-turn-helix transcriptional regulator [Arthrobacter sp. FW306-2-2C-D06B]
MDNRTEVQDFLTSRRARVTAEQAGIPVYGRNRRVKGLRREEVAMLAGVSVDYYVRMERGNISGVSESVLDAVARTLQLSEVEHAHLHDLANTANSSGARRARPVTLHVRPAMQRILDSIVAPAWVRNGKADFLAGNRLGRALYVPIFVDPRRPGNTARFLFLDPRAGDFYPDWPEMARGMVATLRAEAGKHPYDKGLTDLIGELATHSEPFRQLWASHEVLVHRNGTKRLRHPVVGDLELTYEAMQLTTDEGLTLLIYAAEPGSRSEEGLRLLDSWAPVESVEGKPFAPRI